MPAFTVGVASVYRMLQIRSSALINPSLLHALRLPLLPWRCLRLLLPSSSPLALLVWLLLLPESRTLGGAVACRRLHKATVSPLRASLNV